mmetsp:Transcript_42707/g.95945  ORF Transcript_42707/g.95945 Transcript_42707/m.95945 type:complete len:212 (+) Transcript_42707:1826-2461(+)
MPRTALKSRTRKMMASFRRCSASASCKAGCVAAKKRYPCQHTMRTPPRTLAATSALRTPHTVWDAKSPESTSKRTGFAAAVSRMKSANDMASPAAIPLSNPKIMETAIVASTTQNSLRLRTRYPSRNPPYNIEMATMRLTAPTTYLGTNCNTSVEPGMSRKAACTTREVNNPQLVRAPILRWTAVPPAVGLVEYPPITAKSHWMKPSMRNS